MNKPPSPRLYELFESCPSFIKTLEEEILLYGEESQAEVGIGIYKFIEELQKRGESSDFILRRIKQICGVLVAKCPEAALEFANNVEKSMRGKPGNEI